MGRIYKRGATFWADYQDPFGRRQRASLRTKDREVAKTRLRSAELGQRPRGEGSYTPKSLAEAVDDMVTIKRDQTARQYKNKSLHLFRVFGTDLQVHDLTADQVANYVKQRTKEGVARTPLHLELVALRQTLKEAKRRGVYHGSLEIVPSWKIDSRPRDRWLTPEEFTKLIEAVKPKRRTWIWLQCYTSANLSEVTRMGWEHVDFAQKLITVPGRKRTSRHRKVPIHPDLMRYLKTLDRTQPLHEPWKSPNHALRRLCLSAGIPHCSTNDLRRTFGSWMKQQGNDSLVVAHLMGHNSTTMVDRVYGKLSEDTYRDAIARMPARRKPRKSDTPASHTKTRRGSAAE